MAMSPEVEPEGREDFGLAAPELTGISAVSCESGVLLGGVLRTDLNAGRGEPLGAVFGEVIFGTGALPAELPASEVRMVFAVESAGSPSS